VIPDLLDLVALAKNSILIQPTAANIRASLTDFFFLQKKKTDFLKTWKP
jgi:hypothetical protein